MKLPNPRQRDAGASADQAMTPMIDVVFLLLIFFVCASVGQVSDALLPTKLAGGGVAAELPPDEPRPLGEVWVKLHRRGNATVAEVNGTTHPDLPSLERVLVGLKEAGAAGEMPAVLDVDAAVPLGDVIRIYDVCLGAGFASIHFATDG